MDHNALQLQGRLHLICILIYLAIFPVLIEKGKLRYHWDLFERHSGKCRTCVWDEGTRRTVNVKLAHAVVSSTVIRVKVLSLSSEKQEITKMRPQSKYSSWFHSWYLMWWFDILAFWSSWWGKSFLTFDPHMAPAPQFRSCSLWMPPLCSTTTFAPAGPTRASSRQPKKRRKWWEGH